ncbi:hypothetical protein [Methanosarcina horonobensis]|uniref:hypothetical protein n=1 Tax=Methanosarcina horonobensis TaxID=418008 RepID=UPI000A6081BC|nr:hypothetical protein [Methanosarcina horonobensis]
MHKPEEETKGEPKGNVSKPGGKIPDLVKDIVKNVILNSYYTRIEARALEDCSGFLKEKKQDTFQFSYRENGSYVKRFRFS